MVELKFVDVKVSGDVFAEIANASVDLRKISILNKETVDLVKLAFKHNGYIAGGFALQLAKHLKPAKNDTEVYATRLRSAETLEKLVKYFGQRYVCNSDRKWENAGKGDIDIWFADVESLQSFNRSEELANILKSPHERKSTPTGIATQYAFGDYGTRTQVISAYIKPKIEQISGFDIYNCMCAFDGNILTYPEHLMELEAQNMLHVFNWRTQNAWTVNRVVKYMGNRLGYEFLTPETAEEFSDMLLEACEQVQNNLDAKKAETYCPPPVKNPYDDLIQDVRDPDEDDPNAEIKDVRNFMSETFIQQCVRTCSTFTLRTTLNKIASSTTNEKLLLIAALANMNSRDPGYVSLGMRLLIGRSKLPFSSTE